MKLFTLERYVTQRTVAKLTRRITM